MMNNMISCLVRDLTKVRKLAEEVSGEDSSMLGTEGTADYLVDAVKRRFGLE